MILQGSNLETLKTLADNSVDSIVTDPPYGLSFMGKKWDYQVPSVDFWKEAFRVLKPGGHVLSFGGTRTYHRLVVAIEDAGFEIRDQIQWLYGSGFPKSQNVGKTSGDTRFEGWGTALKPANEPICVARKPLEKGLTVAANVLKYGTGAINIDETRVGTETRTVKASASNEDTKKTMGTFKPWEGDYKDVTGRWPANVILDETAATILDEQSGNLKSGKLNQANIKADNKKYGQHDAYTNPKTFEADSGGASRFFYVAKASKKDRGEGNVHPTVKPTKLMEYLIKLVTPVGGTVLDPFMGSGTTGVAAARLGFKFIGCELDEAYCEIAKARIAHAETASQVEQDVNDELDEAAV